MKKPTREELSANAIITEPVGGELGSNLNHNAFILSIIIFVVTVGGWEEIVHRFQLPEMILPAPSAIATSLWKGIVSGICLYHFMITFIETISGRANDFVPNERQAKTDFRVKDQLRLQKGNLHGFKIQNRNILRFSMSRQPLYEAARSGGIVY